MAASTSYGPAALVCQISTCCTSSAASSAWHLCHSRTFASGGAIPTHTAHHSKTLSHAVPCVAASGNMHGTPNTLSPTHSSSLIMLSNAMAQTMRLRSSWTRVHCDARGNPTRCACSASTQAENTAHCCARSKRNRKDGQVTPRLMFITSDYALQVSFSSPAHFPCSPHVWPLCLHWLYFVRAFPPTRTYSSTTGATPADTVHATVVCDHCSTSDGLTQPAGGCIT